MYNFFLLIIIAFLFPSQGLAEEYLRGTVISVDQQKGEVVIRPFEYSSVIEDDQVVEQEYIPVTVRFPEKHRMRQDRQKRRFQCLVPGQQIRLRGEFDRELNLFLARDIRGCGWRGGPDPTGIRSRLGRDCAKDRPYRKSFGRRCSPEKHKELFPKPEQISETKRRLQDAGN